MSFILLSLWFLQSSFALSNIQTRLPSTSLRTSALTPFPTKIVRPSSTLSGLSSMTTTISSSTSTSATSTSFAQSFSSSLASAANSFTDSSSSSCQQLETLGLPKFSLSQSDFTKGTKILTQPGIYTLQSDIVFNPNSAADLGVDYYSAGDVQPEQYTYYDPKAYGIGFFAVIAISGSDILIDLNGYSIVQSEEHALNQRFHSLIELASSPFISGQGPHDFGKEVSASNVCIKNGVLGRSAHSGIHGNGNSNIEIRDLVITDFEVAGIHLNKASDVLIENINVPSSRQDVPVIGRFSAARFIKPWVNKLVSGNYQGTLNIGSQMISPSMVQSQLRDVINQAANQVLVTGSVSGSLQNLFGNVEGLPDGSAIYGIILNGKGVAVNGFPKNVPVSEKSQGVVIRNVHIGELVVNVRERPVLSVDNKTPSSDAVGAILDTEDGFTLSDTAVYLGNPVANAQLIVAKAIHENFDFGHLNTKQNKIALEVVAWAESGKPYHDVLSYMCNGDTMFHVNKGAVAFKLDGSINVTCDLCQIGTVQNIGDIGSTVCNDNVDYMNGAGVSNPLATQPGYNGGDSRGFSLSNTVDANLKNCVVNNVLANAGDAIGVDITRGSARITLENVALGTVQGGMGYNFVDYQSNPTPMPMSLPVHQAVSTSNIQIF